MAVMGWFGDCRTPNRFVGEPANDSFRSEEFRQSLVLTQELSDEWTLQLGGYSLWGRNKTGRRAGDTATAVIRTERVRIADDAGENLIAVELAASAYLGGRWEHVFRLEGRRVRALTDGPLDKGIHRLTLPKDSLWIF